MTILDKMEAALLKINETRHLDNTRGMSEGFVPDRTDAAIDEGEDVLREYESLKGQIAVVPVSTSEARKAALEDFNTHLFFYEAPDEADSGYEDRTVLVTEILDDSTVETIRRALTQADQPAVDWQTRHPNAVDEMDADVLGRIAASKKQPADKDDRLLALAWIRERKSAAKAAGLDNVPVYNTIERALSGSDATVAESVAQKPDGSADGQAETDGCGENLVADGEIK